MRQQNQKSEFTKPSSGLQGKAPVLLSKKILLYGCVSQLSAWPDGDRGMIAQLREGQLPALALNNTGMAVAADLSDPSGMCKTPPPFCSAWMQPLSYSCTQGNDHCQ